MKIASFVLCGGLALAPVPVLAHGGMCGGGAGKALQAQIPALFAQADANGDGSLTLDEFKTFKQLVMEKRTELMFQRLDANGDGGVTLAEIQALAAQRHAGKHRH